jgi:hypothetical protein
LARAGVGEGSPRAHGENVAADGCRRISFGFESGCDRVLRKTNKRFSTRDVQVISALFSDSLDLNPPGRSTPAALLSFPQSGRLAYRKAAPMAIFPPPCDLAKRFGHWWRSWRTRTRGGARTHALRIINPGPICLEAGSLPWAGQTKEARFSGRIRAKRVSLTAELQRGVVAPTVRDSRGCETAHVRRSG